jgi:hypothetical protein
MTVWLGYPRCPSCGDALDLGPSSGLAVCACGLPILVEVEVTARYRVTEAPVLDERAAARAYVHAVKEALGLPLARATGWATP